MIIYSVTVSIENERAEEWCQWMKSHHIPAVMATGYFESYTMQKILEPVVDPDRINYNVLYEVDSLERLREYQSLKAPALQHELQKRYGENVLAIRVVMERLAKS